MSYENQDTRDAVIVRNPLVLGGRPVFRGTRVQLEILFENLADGYTIDEIVESFPTLDRGDLQAALRQACRMMLDAATEVPDADAVTTVRARLF